MVTIKFQKKNITHVLPRKKGEVLLNPSIAHWKDDLFLCSYRVYIRYRDLDTSKYEEDPFINPNHPWLGGEGATTYWYSPAGYDITRLVLVRIHGRNVRVVYNYGVVFGVDARIFQFNQDMFIFLDNIKFKNREIELKNVNCEDEGDCMLLTVRTITIQDHKLQISRGTILCPEKSERVEKNWSFWKNPVGELMVSYGIVPHHEIFRLRIEGDQVVCPNISSVIGENNFFNRLNKYYNGACSINFPKCVSTSTPSLRMTNGNYLAFGHFKYIHEGAVENIDKNSNLYKFNQLLLKKEKIFHPKLVYLMFLYEFSPEFPYTILRISNMFIPKSKFALVFPSGLAFSPRHNKYILSYGDHDSECWLLFMSEDEIDEALMEITDPAKLQFLLI